MSTNIVGIDIGSASLRAVEVKNSDKAKPVVVKYHEVPLPAGSVRRGEVLEEGTVATALKRLWSTAGFKSKHVILGIGGPRVLSRDLSVPKATMTQIKEALPFHVQEMLPVPVDEALLDFYPISESESENGPMINGLLIAAIKEAVTSNIAAVTQAGLIPVQVDLIPFALARTLEPIGVSSGVAAVVSIGANTTNVVITHSGVPQFVRIIPSGSDDITQAIAKKLEIPWENAEVIKRQLGLRSAGVTAETQPAVEAIYDTVGELLTNIRNTINYYANSKAGHVVTRIVASGGGTKMTGLVHALGEVTGIPVTEAEALGEGRSGSAEDQRDSMTTAFALTLGTTA